MPIPEVSRSCLDQASTGTRVSGNLSRAYAEYTGCFGQLYTGCFGRFGYPSMNAFGLAGTRWCQTSIVILTGMALRLRATLVAQGWER